MAWERRGNQRYFYRSKRVGKKVRKIYFGRGPEAELAAETFDLLRAERTRIDNAHRRSRAEYIRVSAELDDIAGQLVCLEAAHELLAGSGNDGNQEDLNMITSSQSLGSATEEVKVDTATYDQHDVADHAAPETLTMDEHGDGGADELNNVGDAEEAGPSLAADLAFQDLVQRANGGDGKALAELRVVLDKNPLIWQRVGDLAAHSRLILVRLIAGNDQLMFESVLLQARDLEAQLASDSPSPLQRLSAEHVVACWLQARYADAMSANATESDAQAKFWSLHQDRAHRRYVTAIKQMAAIRPLLPSSAQVEPARATDAVTAEHCDVSRESRNSDADRNQVGVTATGGSDKHRNGAAHGQNNGNGKPKAANGNGAKAEPQESIQEHDPGNDRPVSRILRFPDVVTSS